MIYRPEEITDKKGESCVFRSLKPEDADALIRFVEQGTQESPYFPWAPGETELTAENAAEYILNFENDRRRLLLGAFRDGRLLGLNELSDMGEWGKSMRHRSAVGGGLLKEAQGRGLGKKLTLAIAAAAFGGVCRLWAYRYCAGNGYIAAGYPAGGTIHPAQGVHPSG